MKEQTSLANELFHRLFPICRSITGHGVRETLRIIREYAEFNLLEYPSGTKCYDWEIPKEWNIKDAYIKNSKGEKVIDFQKSNLHVVNYSLPIHKTISLAELKPHLHTLPQLPEAVPYRTSYYREDWGFCLSQNQYDSLAKDETLEVYIDSTLKDGHLTIAEGILRGKSNKEFLISTYCCHPSLANDNLSGVILTTLLFRELQQHQLRHTYRFLILPETIGAIAYLAHHQEEMKSLAGGFVITTVAGPGTIGYKETFRQNHLIDRVVLQTFKEENVAYRLYPFKPDGSDERQYSSPGFRIPVATITKDKYYEYDYYHTSLDDLNFVSAANLVETLKLYVAAIEKLEMNQTYLSLNPYGEVQLGKRGLYPQTGGAINQKPNSDQESGQREFPNQTSGDFPSSKSVPKAHIDLDALTWFLFLADGQHSLMDMAERTGLPMKQLDEIAKLLMEKNLVRVIDEECC